MSATALEEFASCCGQSAMTLFMAMPVCEELSHRAPGLTLDLKF